MLTHPTHRRVLTVAAVVVVAVATVLLWAGGTAVHVVGSVLLAAVSLAAAKVIAELATTSTAAAARAEQLDAVTQRQRAGLADLRTSVAATSALITKVRATQASVMEGQQEQRRHGELLLQRVRRAERKSGDALVGIDKTLERVRGAEARAGDALLATSRLTERVEGLRQQQQRNLTEITDTTRRSTAGLDQVMGTRFQQLERAFDPSAIEELRSWAERLGVEVTDHTLHYLARKLLFVEAGAVGRLAASTADGVFRALVAASVRSVGGGILEIGVLYGVNAAYLWEVEGFDRSDFHLTLLDPFEGYYGQDRDQFTGLRVTEAIARTNLGRVGAPDTAFRILHGYSTDPAIIAAALDRSYGLVFVDGDHSYDGVRHDVETFAAAVAPGGILMIDDYGAPSWPGVTRYVDEIIASGQAEHVGTFRRTAVFRMTGATIDVSVPSPGDQAPSVGESPAPHAPAATIDLAAPPAHPEEDHMPGTTPPEVGLAGRLGSLLGSVPSGVGDE